MKQDPDERTLIRIRFDEDLLGKLALAKLHQIPDLTVSIFRGRTLPEDSSFEVEIEGPASLIKEFARWTSEQELRTGASGSDLTGLGEGQPSLKPQERHAAVEEMPSSATPGGILKRLHFHGNPCAPATRGD